MLLRRLTDNLDVMLTHARRPRRRSSPPRSQLGNRTLEVTERRAPADRGRRCASSRPLLAEAQRALAREPPAGRAAVAGARPPDAGRRRRRGWPPRGCAATLPAARPLRRRRRPRSRATAAGPRACWPAGSTDQAELIEQRPEARAARSSSASSSCSSATATASSSSPATSAASTSVNRRAGHLRPVRHHELRDLAGGLRLRPAAARRAERRAVAAGARRSAEMLERTCRDEQRRRRA